MELRRLGHPGLARPLTSRPLSSRAALVWLLALTALRLGVAAHLPLSPDETYYWVWSRALAPGYLDHPPMVALWIRAGTWIAGDNALGIRLLAPFAVGLGSLFVADAASRLVPVAGSGILAAALLNATLLFGIGGVTMTPDTPLLFFWCAALAAMARLAAGGGGAWFVAAGLCVGLALASKYTAAMLALGAVLWVVAVPDLRRRLAGPWPWLGALAAAVPFLPVVWWNAQHGWASFAKQGGRAADFHPARAAQFLAELVFGQIGLATPLIFVLCAAGLTLASRIVWRRREPGWTLLAALSLPSVLLFVAHAFGDRVQGNWPAIIYPAAAIAATGLIASRWQRLRIPALALGLAITLGVYVQALWAPLPLPGRLDPLARELASWPAMAQAVDRVRVSEGALFVAAEQYGLAGELALAMPPGVPVVGIEPRWAYFALPPAPIAGRTGILVRSTRRDGMPDPADWSNVVPIGQTMRMQNGVVETYRLFRVTGRADGTPAAMMPRP
jgi:4-amino-4-deoxy-L-arabinose transferase-like glycosyltransferase